MTRVNFHIASFYVHFGKNRLTAAENFVISIWRG